MRGPSRAGGKAGAHLPPVLSVACNRRRRSRLLHACLALAREAADVVVGPPLRSRRRRRRGGSSVEEVTRREPGERDLAEHHGHHWFGSHLPPELRIGGVQQQHDLLVRQRHAPWRVPVRRPRHVPLDRIRHGHVVEHRRVEETNSTC